MSEGGAQQAVVTAYQLIGSDHRLAEICSQTLPHCPDWFAEKRINVAGESVSIFNPDSPSSKVTRRMLLRVRTQWDPPFAQGGRCLATRDPRYYAMFLTCLAAKRAAENNKRVDGWNDLGLTKLVAKELWDQTVALVEEAERQQRELVPFAKSKKPKTQVSVPTVLSPATSPSVAAAESRPGTFPSADDWLSTCVPDGSAQGVLTRVWIRHVYPVVQLGTPRVSDGLTLPEMYDTLTGVPRPMARAFLSLAEQFVQAGFMDHAEWMLRASRDLWGEPSLSAPRALAALRRSAT